MTEFAVMVLCGGRGTRLWPLSRASRPKYLLDIGSAGSLLEMTLHRAIRITTADKILIVTSQQHAEPTLAVARRFGIHTVLTEPSPRDTTAAAVLGVREAERRWGPSRVVSLPADHEIEDEEAWAATIRMALEAPVDRIVTIGVPPTSPSVEYGYIESTYSGTHRTQVASFREKPDGETAARYIAAGNFLWNTAMMSFTTDGFLSALSITSSDVIQSVEDASGPEGIDPRRWQDVRSVPLEQSLMEPAAAAGRVDVIRGGFAWRDLGTWTELADVLPKSENAVSTLPGARVIVTAEGTNRRYVNAGIPGLILVDTGDVILITTDRAASQVKAGVALVEQAGWEDVL
jgi:mannose-1-phosphate guanylyltransferase